MVEIPRNRGYILKDMFAESSDTVVLSYVQGHHGVAFADSDTAPSCAVIRVSDIAFISGDPQSPAASALLDTLFCGYDGDELLVTPLQESWATLITGRYAGRCESITRYAFFKSSDGFNIDLLQRYAARLPDGYEMHKIDKTLYAQTFLQPFCADLCNKFDSAVDFTDRGLGFVVTYNGTIVAGASSFTVYDGGIEIEIDTHPEHRRRGLATACAARLMVECLQRGLYPSWDAANTVSVALATKLGYRFSHEYTAFSVYATAP